MFFFSKNIIFVEKKLVLVFIKRALHCRKHVVFGRVVSGEEVVVALEELAVDNRHRPLNTVTIQRCGQLLAKSKNKGNIDDLGPLRTRLRNTAYRQVFMY